MVIDRSKHNKYTTGAIYGNQTSGGITTDANGNITGNDGLSYSGGIIYINGGAGGGISQELIDMLTNQDAFSYFNVSDGINTVNVEAKQEKDVINLNIIGDNESVETKVSTEKYLPETYYNGTGLKPGRYSVSYNKVLIPDISGGDPVEIIKWVITIKKIYGNPIFPSVDFNGVQLLENGNSLGAFSIDSDRLTVTSNQTTGLQQIVIQLDSLINFTEIRLISSEDYTSSVYTTVTDIEDITIQTFTTVLISQADTTRYWKLDEEGKLFTDYDVYTTKTLGAKDLIWSDHGYRVGDFVQGISGGIFHIDDGIGTVYAELDKLKVRKKAYFETLEIVNVNTVGGKQIISPAGAITIRKVDINDTYYRCYFLGEQDGVEIENRFKVNDLAFSQNFNIKKPGNYEQVANHYFWRRVVGVSTQVDSDGNHYIDLSVIDCDTDSDIPHVNDVVAQLGNTNDPDRQSAMIFSSVDSESPRIMLCHGINTYTLNATNYFDLGVNHATNQAYMNVYGNTYIGAKDGSTYIDYSQTNGLTIKAHISASSTYGGQQFSDVFVTSENLSSSVKAIVGDDLEFLQNQIDGSIESYFYDYSPTLNNYPAIEWVTEADRQRHNGDTFTNIQEFISDSLTPDAGKSWRWVKNDSGVWGWIPISDSDAVAALKKAGQAQDTADGKRKVFTQKPGLNDDYQVGDLWVNATFTDTNGLLLYSNDLLRANTSKNKGELFSISHWELASKYTDDTMASDALAKANAAQAAATAAGSAASQAQTEINAYKLEIDDIFSDGIITTSERSRLNTLKDTINTTLFDVQTTYNNVYNNSALDGKTQKTALKTAYTQFSNAATTLLNSVTTVISKNTISKGDVSAVDQAYNNFNTKYVDYVAALHAANLEIMNTLSNTAYANAVNKFAWLNGLFDPDQTTTIEGGVVTTGVLALGKTTSGVFNVNAGINGVSNSSYLGNGIALWFGGDMIDKDNYTAGNRPANVATSLIRFDGSGYLGYIPNSDSSKDEAAIWWDASGNIHANPLSFFVGPSSVGLLLSAFQVVPTSVGTPAAQYIIQRAPFQTVRIGNAYLGYDVVNNAVYVYTKDASGNETACNFYARGGVSSLGFASGSGGAGGLDVDAMWDILGEDSTEQIHPSHISTALSTYATQDWVTEKLSNITIDTTNLVTTNTTQTISALKTITAGLKVSGRLYGTGDDEGIVVGRASNSYAGITLGEHNGTHASFYLNPNNDVIFRYKDSSNVFDVKHPKKSGTIALVGESYTKSESDGKYVTLSTAQTITGLKSFGTNVSTSGGEINRMAIIPYKHTGGPWYVNSYDTTSTAYLRIKYGNTVAAHINHLGDLWVEGKIAKGGGTASQFLMADGSVKGTYDVYYASKTRFLEEATGLARGDNDSSIEIPSSLPAGIRTRFKNNVGASSPFGWNTIVDMTAFSGGSSSGAGYRNQFLFCNSAAQTDGSFWVRNGVDSTWNAWKKVLTEGNYPYYLDSRYVKKSGDTMTGKLTISHASNESMIVNSTGAETYIRVQNAGASKSCFGWHNNASVGTYMYSSACNKYLGIMDNGTPYFNGSTIWHAGNDGSGSGLDADLLDGLHGGRNGGYVLNISLGDILDYGYTAVGLVDLTNPSSNPSKQSLSIGKVGVYRMNAVGGYNCTVTFAIQRVYNTNGMVGTYSLCGNASYFKPVTFIYNGVKYGGFAFKLGEANGNVRIQLQYGDVQPFKVDYKKIQAGTTTVLNSEINNSIVEVTSLDNRISAIASSATKLQTARTLWGQSFDGTGNVNGHLSIGKIVPQVNAGRAEFSLVSTTDIPCDLWLGTNNDYHWSINERDSTERHDLSIYSRLSGKHVMRILSDGKVGIGTTSPSYKLHVAGDIYANGGWLRTSGNVGWYSETHGGGIYMTDSSYVRVYGYKVLYSSSGYLAPYSSGTWISMARRTDCIYADSNNTASSAHCLFRTKWNNGNALCYGGLGDQMGFYAFNKANIDSNSNAVAWSTYWTSNGTIHHGGALEVSSTIFSNTGIWTNGYVSAKGNNTSDIRLKTDIKNFNAISIIKSLRPVSFKWNELARKNSKVFDTDEVQYGLIAQEVKAVAPWAAVDNMFKDGYMGVRYDKFIPVLMKAQIETIDEVADLKRRVADLEKENKRLKELYYGK